MTERLVMVAMHPKAHIWDALCERTCELASLLEHIESTELTSRKSGNDGLVRCVHLWRARANVPGVLAHHIDAGLLEWTTHTEWRVREHASRWDVRPRSLKGATLCEGEMRLSSALGGRGTRIEVDLAVVAPQPSAGWQAITCAILLTHFRKLIEAASVLLETSPTKESLSGARAAYRPPIPQRLSRK
jgi:hypothetical protein